MKLDEKWITSSRPMWEKKFSYIKTGENLPNKILFFPIIPFVYVLTEQNKKKSDGKSECPWTDLATDMRKIDFR